MAIVLLASLGGTAAAKDKARDKKDVARSAMLYAEAAWNMHNGKSVHQLESADDCRTLIADAKKLGLGSDEHLVDTYYGDRANNLIRKDADYNYYVTVGDLPTICDAYAELEPVYAVLGELAGHYGQSLWRTKITVEDVGPDYARGIVEQAKKCMATVDAAIAASSADLVVAGVSEDSMTLAEVKADVCQVLTDWGNEWVVSLDALNAQRKEDAEGAYKAVGIKGARLELFSTYNVRWYAAGCTKEVFEPKKLKKAKKLFVWRESEDGRITIDKYVFKGDKYTETSRTTYNPDTAYKYCK